MTTRLETARIVLKAIEDDCGPLSSVIWDIINHLEEQQTIGFKNEKEK